MRTDFWEPTSRISASARFWLRKAVSAGALFGLGLWFFSVGTVKAGRAVSTGPAVVTQRGPHQQRWEYVSRLRDERGDEVLRTNTFVELGTGLNRWDSTLNVWVAASANLEVVNGYGLGRNTQHRVIFAPKTTSPGGLIDLETPEGERIVLQPLGLAVTDHTGRSFFLAEVKESIGEKVGTNAMLYRDAFDFIHGSICMKTTIDGIESDVILSEKISRELLHELGIDLASARLEVWHQVLKKPRVQKKRAFVKRRFGQRDEDHTVEFGGMSISSGTAFSIEQKGENSEPPAEVVVAKDFIEIDGADFLIESVPFADAEAELNQLPEAPHAGVLRKEVVEAALARRAPVIGPRSRPVSLAASRRESGSVREIAFAAARGIPSGYVIDYPITLTTQTNFTFRADTTYYVTSKVFLHGRTRLEGGTVIKTVPYDVNVQAQVAVFGELECLTSPYNPAIFTARDDNSVGEILPESTGAVRTNIWYSTFNLAYYGVNPLQLHDVQTRYGHVGILMGTPGPHQLWNLQVFHCYRGIEFRNAVVKLRNALLHHTRYAVNPITSTQGSIAVEHITVDSASLLFGNGGYGSLFLTNSILCNVGNAGATNIFKDHVETVTAAAFEITGRGRHYLPAGSILRNAGTSAISPEMAQILRGTTTLPPTILTNNITADTTLAPAIQRDGDLPDLGFHYQPLDYCASGVLVSNATLKLAEGVAVGIYGTNGFVIGTGGRFVSHGLPGQLNQIVAYNAVQEEPATWNGRVQSMICLANPVQELDFRFTRSSMLANINEGRMFIAGLAETTNNVAALTIRDSHLINFSQAFRTLTPSSVHLLNNVFERCSFLFEQGGARGKIYAPMVLSFYNNLYLEGGLTFTPRSGTTPWGVRDNLFQNEVLIAGLPTASFTPNHNAFRPGLNPMGGTNNVVNLTAAFVSGLLGKYYYARPGPMMQLVNAGSRSAAAAGLFHSTTDATPLSQEGASTVDIGFHYLAMDAGSSPVDLDADTIPDWQEDLNGNGEADEGELNFADRDTDLDGDTDDDELKAGTDPRNSGSLKTRSLASWRFATNYTGLEGQTPLVLSNVSIVPGIEGNGVIFTATNGPVMLQYRGLETNGHANVSLARGAIRFRTKFKWFSNDPALDLPGGLYTYRGLGPQEWVTLVETTNLAVRIDPDGTNIFIISRTANGHTVTNLQAPLRVEPDDPRPKQSDPGNSYIYDVLVNYAPEETSIYWGAPGVVARGSGIQVWDGTSEDNRILSIGSAPDGTGKIQAILDEIVTYNTPGILHTNPWQFSAIALSYPPALNLIWKSSTNLVIDIKKRAMGSTDWHWLPGAIGTNLLDTNVVPGVRYEYNLNTGFTHTNGSRDEFGNHMTAAARGSALEQRGKVILLVDQTMGAPLATEINTLVTNLVGDGWGVLRADVPRHVDNYSSAVAFHTNNFNITNRIAPFIRSNYARFSTNIKHILIVGHVTIPYTGDQADDGHWGIHQGTWASDLFYGDIDGVWSDTRQMNSALYPENWNFPGDGKLDNDYVPTNALGVAELEMPVARIDFARLPAFTGSETELLRRYLIKNARYRHKELAFPSTAIGIDHFADWRATFYPEQMAAETASKLGPLNDWERGDVFRSPGSFLLGVQAGAGNVDRINDSQPGYEQTTADFAAGRTSPSCAFYFFRASYFQDWNLENDFMRAVLAPTNGGLAAGWFLTMGVWRTDPLGAGQELGAASREIINTRMKLYAWYGQSARATEILGDSTLRYPVLAPPVGLTRTITNGVVYLSWTASMEPNSTYHVYRSNFGITGDFVRLTPTPLNTTAFSNLPQPRGPVTYMVRTVRLSVTGSGSFTNLSQGVFIAR